MRRADRSSYPTARDFIFASNPHQGTAWTLRYRFGGRDRWMALGSYPDMELAEARKAARAKRTLVDAGRDPLLPSNHFANFPKENELN
jgi:hypothetical protein